MGSLLFFDAADLTLNLGTIFGFFLLVGIVVDDSVVVGESIAAEREKGKNALDAAVSGARAMVGPLTIGAITTILAFLPFLFITSPAFPDRERVPLCRDLRPARLSGCGVLHSPGASLAREALEPFALERCADSGGRVAG